MVSFGMEREGRVEEMDENRVNDGERRREEEGWV